MLQQVFGRLKNRKTKDSSSTWLDEEEYTPIVLFSTQIDDAFKFALPVSCCCSCLSFSPAAFAFVFSDSASAKAEANTASHSDVVLNVRSVSIPVSTSVSRAKTALKDCSSFICRCPSSYVSSPAVPYSSRKSLKYFLSLIYLMYSHSLP